MTDFKAPPPPPQDFLSETEESPEETVAAGNEVPAQTEVQGSAAAAPQQNRPSPVQQNLAKLQEQGTAWQVKFNALQEPKKLALVAGVMFVIGLLFGSIMFGGEEVVTVQQGLEGVVANPDIKTQMRRCGQQGSPSDPCVLYIMNSYNYEKFAKDFFEEAIKLTGRRQFVIESDNMHYGSMRIRPGEFAQIKIPKL